MKSIVILVSSVMGYVAVSAQTHTVSSEILSDQNVKALFPEAVSGSLDISFPIVQVYHYTDKSGSYYCLLTESRDELFEDGALGGLDTLNRKITALNLKTEGGAFTKTWEVNDFTASNKNADEDELSIWFWKSYTTFKDIDGDGLVDPIVVYGTRANFNYTDNGRVKLVIYFKGEKISIRHQNGVLDGERETQVDNAFYELPVKIQTAVKRIMTSMESNRHTIFPFDWEEQMKDRKTFLADRY